MSTRSVLKLNVNWLRTFSFTVLCAMMFLTFANTVLACDCSELAEAASAALEAWQEAIDNYNIALDALQNALDSEPLDFNLINSANQAVDAAEEARDKAKEKALKAMADLYNCMNSNCGSGGCDSGSCG